MGHRARARFGPGDGGVSVSLPSFAEGVAGAHVTPVRVVRYWALRERPPRRLRVPREGLQPR